MEAKRLELMIRDYLVVFMGDPRWQEQFNLAPCPSFDAQCSRRLVEPPCSALDARTAAPSVLCRFLGFRLLPRYVNEDFEKSAANHYHTGVCSVKKCIVMCNNLKCCVHNAASTIAWVFSRCVNTEIPIEIYFRLATEQIHKSSVYVKRTERCSCSACTF